MSRVIYAPAQERSTGRVGMSLRRIGLVMSLVTVLALALVSAVSGRRQAPVLRA